jgi:hypothetical protein
MVKKSKNNNVLYAGAFIAILAVSCLSVYAFTDIFSPTEIVGAAGVVEDVDDIVVPSGSEWDQTQLIDNSGQSIYTEGGQMDTPLFLAQSFQQGGGTLSGFGVRVEKIGYIADNPLCFGITDSLPGSDADIKNADSYLVLGVIQPADMPSMDTEYWIWFELSTPVDLAVGQTYYLVGWTEEIFEFADLWSWTASYPDAYADGVYFYWQGAGWTDYSDVDMTFFTWYSTNGNGGEDPPSSTPPVPWIPIGGGLGIAAVSIGYVGMVGRKPNGKKKKQKKR